jgi:membrane protein DedA with SNARE-associated domain
VTDWVQDLLGEGSYGVLTALLVLENLFPPIPSEIILPFAGALVSDGGMGFVGAVTAATLGSLVGALLLYAIGRYGGRPLIYRYSWILRLNEAQLDRADAWFDRRGPWIVLFGRLIPGVRSVVSIPAGASEMPLALFIGLTTLGSAVWNSALIGAGWALGDNWEEAAAVVDSAQLVVIVLVAVSILALAAYLVRRRTRTRAAGTS